MRLFAFTFISVCAEALGAVSRDAPASMNTKLDPDPQRLPLKRLRCVCSFAVTRLEATGFTLLVEEHAGVGASVAAPPPPPSKTRLLCDCKTKPAKVVTAFRGGMKVFPLGPPLWDYPSYGGNASTTGLHMMSYGRMGNASFLQHAETEHIYRVINASPPLQPPRPRLLREPPMLALRVRKRSPRN